MIPVRRALKPLLTLLLAGACGAGSAEEPVRGEILYTVRCGVCHVAGADSLQTPPAEMSWLFDGVAVRAHRFPLEERELAAIIEYLQDWRAR